MTRQKAYTPDGEIEVDVVTPLDKLRTAKNEASTIEERVAAIEKYLGV